MEERAGGGASKKAVTSVCARCHRTIPAIIAPQLTPALHTSVSRTHQEVLLPDGRRERALRFRVESFDLLAGRVALAALLLEDAFLGFVRGVRRVGMTSGESRWGAHCSVLEGGCVAN